MCTTCIRSGGCSEIKRGHTTDRTRIGGQHAARGGSAAGRPQAQHHDDAALRREQQARSARRGGQVPKGSCRMILYHFSEIEGFASPKTAFFDHAGQDSNLRPPD